ncbi:hypothetical protein FSP39_008565 [Pinctada imbricata]|uniref:Uncharacterized protein n=1 Tax=Pinctada imbricata TaxID=66713 RepID=A0AA88XNL8_PINIB|nr:hypothetical protein FSP39_008565 [Pinctada imbricata]
MGKDRTKKIKQLIKENRPSKLKSYVKKHRIDLNGIILGKERSLLHFCCKYGTGDTFSYGESYDEWTNRIGRELLSKEK